jgi:hypothetical protein
VSAAFVNLFLTQDTRFHLINSRPCTVFENRQEAFSKERLEAVLDAVEGLRQNGSGAR